MKIFCIFLISTILTLNTNSQTVDIQYDTVCAGRPVTLRAVTDLPESSITSYAWDLNGDNIYSDATGKTTELQANGNSSIHLKIVATTGTFYKHKDVIYYQNPTALFAIMQGCTGDTIRFIDYSSSNSGNITDYKWDFIGTGLNSASGKSNIYHIYNNQGTYEPTLRVTSAYGCTSSYSTPLRIKEKPGLQISKNTLCLGDSSVFINEHIFTTDSIAHIKWDFGDGTTSNRVINSIKHLYKNTGIYKVSVLLEHVNGCQNSVAFPVDIKSKPTLNLVFSSDTIIFEGAEMNVSVSAAFDSIIWSTGEKQPQISITNAGLYKVDAFKDLCHAGKSFSITVKHDSEAPAPVLLSNIITPNNDGINDKLTFLNLDCYPVCSLSVYNNRGVKVYLSKNFQNEWDMQVDGKVLKTGSYYYLIEFNSIKFTGNFNVLQ
jgi:gliding motility-associated-like protein